MLFDTCRKSEREHRRDRRLGVSLSVYTAGQYFAVKWLDDALSDLRRNPVLIMRPSQYLHMREECFLAHALADQFGTKELANWSAPAAFGELDYVKLMEVQS